MIRTKVITSLALTVLAYAALAAPITAGSRVGLGQDSAKEPPKIRNLRLTDPLVQQKYLNEPDMIRFLRGTYAEACTRGLVVEAAKQVKFDVKRQYTPDQRDIAVKLIDSQRVWRMSSFELEALFGGGYLNAANYCDCIIKEVTDVDLVNPKKGMEVVEKIPQATQQSCERMAQEKTKLQLDKQKTAK